MSPVPKRNWGAGVATDSPVAGLRSAHHVLRPDRAFWFRRLATPVLSEDSARFRGLLRSDRLATFLPLHRSGRTVRRHFSLRGSLHPSDPKVSGISRLLRSDRLATFFPRPRSGRTTRRHFVHRGLLYPAGPKAAPASRRSTRFDPKTHLSFPGRSSGPGAIIRRVSATRPPAAYEDSLPKHPVFALSPRCPFMSPVARFYEQHSAATRDHSTRKLPDPVRSVRCTVRPSRLRAPFGRSSAAVPTPKPPSSPCGSDAPSRRSSS